MNILFSFVQSLVLCLLELSLFTNVISYKILSSPKSGFISGTEIMIYHLKRKGMEVGVWDDNNLIV